MASKGPNFQLSALLAQKAGRGDLHPTGAEKKKMPTLKWEVKTRTIFPNLSSGLRGSGTTTWFLMGVNTPIGPGILGGGGLDNFGSVAG